MMTVRLEDVVVSKMKSNVFQHVAVVKVLLVNKFVFMTIVLTKVYLTHTDRHNKYFINKKVPVFFILFIYCKTTSNHLIKSEPIHLQTN